MKKVSTSDWYALLIAVLFMICFVYITKDSAEQQAKAEMLRSYPYDHSHIPDTTISIK